MVTVFFMNEELLYEQKWASYLTRTQLTVEQIMEWAGEWNSSDLHSVPQFETVSSHQADIRVKLSSKHCIMCGL